MYAQMKEARNTRKKELCREVGELCDRRRKDRHSQRKEKCGNHSKQLRMKQLNHKDIANTVFSGHVSYNDIPTTSNHNNDDANRCGVFVLFETGGEEQLSFKMCEDVTENIHMNDSDRVFSGDCSTREVYEKGTKEIALSVVGGINSTIFAYGQTSSGKTYTMNGITDYSVADIYDYIQRVFLILNMELISVLLYG
ncbi:Adenosinetriphosphatase [Abeliophyllum distichum]|uniref:Adenosinetriphosphatase n=1 Tax=Abeliophyllum distichum TaxID=126358 RepID=A0ABD1TCY5_9LAMI